MTTTESNIIEPFRIAQEAIHLPEVQAMIKRLADFNLAVSMPHMHATDDDGVERMVEMPAGTVQVERNLVNTFVPASVVEEEEGLLPVAWRYEDGIVACAQTCPHE